MESPGNWRGPSTAIGLDADAFALTLEPSIVRASRVILATGGRSLPKSGSDGAGYSLARALGHSIVSTTPALAPLVLWPLALFYGGVVVPAPGGGGFIEGAFAALLKPSIPVSVFAASLIWWRFYTFYLYLIAGGIAAGDAALRALRKPDPDSADSNDHD